MKVISALCRAFVLVLGYFVWLDASPACAVTFDFAHVGNPGNLPHRRTGNGAVATVYGISKTEVTNGQYTEFLNAVDPTGLNSLDLFNPEMAGRFGGIEKTGTTDGARYLAQSGRENNPVTYVSFFDAMRFVNWLHNGQGTGNTEVGTYTIGNGLNEVRSPDARFWIPSEDEWYKAAYHDASAGTDEKYFGNAIGNRQVLSNQPSDDPGAINFFRDNSLADGFNDGYAVTGTRHIGPNPFTDVGAYTEATSPYGTYDQNGNVWEWNEGIVRPLYRRLRGGSWDTQDTSILAPDVRIIREPTEENSLIGFRVATVPEPTMLFLSSFAACGILFRRTR